MVPVHALWFYRLISPQHKSFNIVHPLYNSRITTSHPLYCGSLHILLAYRAPPRFLRQWMMHSKHGEIQLSPWGYAGTPSPSSLQSKNGVLCLSYCGVRVNTSAPISQWCHNLTVHINCCILALCLSIFFPWSPYTHCRALLHNDIGIAISQSFPDEPIETERLSAKSFPSSVARDIQHFACSEYVRDSLRCYQSSCGDVPLQEWNSRTNNVC